MPPGAQARTMPFGRDFDVEPTRWGEPGTSDSFVIVGVGVGWLGPEPRKGVLARLSIPTTRSAPTSTPASAHTKWPPRARVRVIRGPRRSGAQQTDQRTAPAPPGRPRRHAIRAHHARPTTGRGSR